jgi:acyl carrier protein
LSQDVITARNDSMASVVIHAATTAQSRVPAHRGLFNGDADEHVLKAVCSAVGAVLHMPPDSIEPDTAYLDLGVDSILAIEIVGRINAGLGISLRSVDLFNYASPASLARHIASSHANGIRVPVEPSDDADPLLAMLRGVYAGDIVEPDANALARLIGGS